MNNSRDPLLTTKERDVCVRVTSRIERLLRSSTGVRLLEEQQQQQQIVFHSVTLNITYTFYVDLRMFVSLLLYRYIIIWFLRYVCTYFGFGNTIPFGTPDSISDFWNSDYSSHISFPSFSRILLFLSQIPQRLKQKQKKTKNRYLIWSTFVTNRSLYLPADRWKKKWTKETRELANTKNRFL